MGSVSAEDWAEDCVEERTDRARSAQKSAVRTLEEPMRAARASVEVRGIIIGDLSSQK